MTDKFTIELRLSIDDIRHITHLLYTINKKNTVGRVIDGERYYLEGFVEALKNAVPEFEKARTFANSENVKRDLLRTYNKMCSISSPEEVDQIIRAFCQEIKARRGENQDHD